MHGHNSDPAFDNIILHVVGENDKKVYNSRGKEIPAVKLLFDPALYEKYLNLINDPSVIACQADIKLLDGYLIRHWLSNLLIERLQEKSEHILKILSETGNNWEESFYRLLSRYFGFRVNTEPFELLSSALPLRIIRKHSDNRFQIEALLFGSAGLLDEGLFRDAVTDDYYNELIREYKILSAKYSLKPLPGWIWKFSRLRPANFPTLRISQLASMLTISGGLFSRVLDAPDVFRLKKIFEVAASDYWTSHFVFGKKSYPATKITGSQATDILLINAVIPAIFVYGQKRDSVDIREKAITFLEEIAPEKNKIINEWNDAGINAGSAFCSQALLQLRNNYCNRRRCLDCMVGARLISQGKRLRKNEEMILEP
jgi:hypothetical protein